MAKLTDVAVSLESETHVHKQAHSLKGKFSYKGNVSLGNILMSHLTYRHDLCYGGTQKLKKIILVNGILTMGLDDLI